MRYYEDLVEGLVEESGTRTLTRDELITFATQYDPQYFHADGVAAKDSIFGDVIASGIYTMAVWRNSFSIARLSMDLRLAWNVCASRRPCGR
jgi:acyl dehydratase